MQSMIILWVGSYVTMTSSIGSLMLMAGGLGGFTGSALVGELFEYDPMWLMYLCLIATVCACIIFAALNVFVRVYSRGGKERGSGGLNGGIKEEETEGLRKPAVVPNRLGSKELAVSCTSLY